MILESFDSIFEFANYHKQGHSFPLFFITLRKIVIFKDCSTDNDGTIVSRHWDFGDGKYNSKKNPWHRYAKPGNYSVTLTVTDNEGVSNSISKTVSITK